MKTAFWVLFFVSTGSYNGGTVTNYDYQFASEASCKAVAQQLYDAEYGITRIATAMCVEVQP